MNWEAIGAVGEILGAIAVLVTLAYLAAQIRQNTRTMKASTSYSAMRDIHQITDNNERYIALTAKSLRKEELTFEEHAHMVERFLAIMRTFENMWHQQRLGNLSLEQFERHLDEIRWTTSSPLARRMWVHLAPTFDPEFRAVVDSAPLAEEAPISSMLKAFAALDPNLPNQS